MLVPTVQDASSKRQAVISIIHSTTAFFKSVYSIQNGWLCPSSRIINTRKHNWICFCPQVRGRGPLERTNLNHWTDLSDSTCLENECITLVTNSSNPPLAKNTFKWLWFIIKAFPDPCLHNPLLWAIVITFQFSVLIYETHCMLLQFYM
jgi:hypothetical protein